MFFQLVKLSRPWMFRPQSTFKPITSRINTANSVVDLMKFYSSTNLESDQKLYFLRVLLDKMIKSDDIKTVFKSQTGNEFIKDIIKESLKMKPENKTLVLDLISKPYHSIQSNIITLIDIKTIVTGITENIDPASFPFETIRSFKNAAKIGMMNFYLEKKCFAALEKLEGDNFQPINFALEGAYRIPRNFSMDIIKCALKKLEKMNLSKINERELINLWTNMGYIKHKFNYEHEIYNEITNLMMNLKFINMNNYSIIVEYMKKTVSCDERIISLLYNQILQNANRMEFFGSSSLEDFLFDLENVYFNNCKIYMTENIASQLMNLLVKMNSKKRMGNSELNALLHFINHFTKLTKEAESKLNLNLNSENSFAYIKLCTCLLLYKNNTSFKQQCEILSFGVLKSVNLSLASFATVYALINALPKVNRGSNIKQLMNYIEKTFDSSFTDLNSYKLLNHILDRSKNVLKDSDLWEIYQRKISLIMMNSFEKLKFPHTRITETLVSIYNPYLNSYKEWTEISRIIVNKLKSDEYYNCIHDKYDVPDILGFLELTNLRKNTETESITHFLSLNVCNPNHRILKKASQLLISGNIQFLLDKKFKLSEDALITKIFTMKYYKELNKFIENINKTSILKKMNYSLMKNFVILLSQYAYIRPDQIKVLKMLTPIDEINSLHYNISLLVGEKDKNLESVLPEFLKVNETMSINYLMEKINLYLNLADDHPGFSEFEVEIKRIILEKAVNNPMIFVDCVEALTSVCKKNNEQKRFNEFFESNFSEADLSLIDVNDIARALYCFANQKAEIKLINKLESRLDGHGLQNHIIEMIIHAYKKNGINTEYFEKLMTIAIDNFGEEILKEIADI